MTVKLPHEILIWQNNPSYPARVRNYYLKHYEDLSNAQLKELHQLAEKCVERANASNVEDWKFTAKDTLKLVEDLEGKNGQEMQQIARDRILAEKVAESQPLTKADQEKIVAAIRDSSPLKPVEDLIKWLKEKWEKIIYPCIQSLKKIFDAVIPWFESVLEAMPEAFDVLRKDLLVPYFTACKDAATYLKELEDDLNKGEYANSLEFAGVPEKPPVDIDPLHDAAMAACLSVPGIRGLAAGTINYHMMAQYEKNIKGGYRNKFMKYKALLDGGAPSAYTLATDMVRMARSTGRQASGLASTLAGAIDEASSVEVPDWFISRTEFRWNDDFTDWDIYLKR